MTSQKLRYPHPMDLMLPEVSPSVTPRGLMPQEQTLLVHPKDLSLLVGNLSHLRCPRGH